MKNLFLTLICSILVAATAFADESSKLRFTKFQEVNREEGNLMMQMLETVRKQGGQGWRDGNDNRPAALIRVKLENIPLSEAKNIRFETSSHNSLQYDYSKVFDRHEIWLWSDGDREDIFIKATYKGASTIYNIHKIKPKTTYDAILHSEELINIVVNVKPEGAKILLENGMSAITPAPIYDVSPGLHTLTIDYKGNIQKHQIEVSEKSFTFPESGGYYDLREKKNVVLVSEPKLADLFILTDNGTYENIGKAGRSYQMMYGPTTIIAKIGEKADTVQFNVDENTEFIQFNPIKKKQFEATAYYGGQKVPALLYINGDRYSEKDYQTYSLNLPIGETYELKMSYLGNTKSRQIHVSENMDPVQIFKIERKSTFVWPWQKDFDPAIAGISVGYVNKQYVSRGEGEKLEQDIYGSEGKSMHGVQAGFYWTPAFHWGLGIYTGLFYEAYFSSNSDYDFDEYIEHCLYMPIHAYYRLPLGRKIHIAIHGGIGMDYAFSGKFSNSSSSYDDWTDFYGQEGFPKRFNLSGEFGLDLRFGAFGISASISRGILDHKMYDSLGDIKSVQNKMSISISYVIGGSYD